MKKVQQSFFGEYISNVNQTWFSALHSVVFITALALAVAGYFVYSQFLVGSMVGATDFLLIPLAVMLKARHDKIKKKPVKPKQTNDDPVVVEVPIQD